jgi:hypothetical protein
MDGVWVGLAEVSIGPTCTLDLTGAGAFVWCATQASNKKEFVNKVGKMLASYGLNLIEYGEIGLAIDIPEPAGDLFEIATRAAQDPTYILYGTFHSYAHHTS